MAQGPRRSLWCTGSTFTLLPYAQLERCDEALDAVAAFEEAVERERREGNPRVTIELAILDTQTYYKNQDDRDHWLEGYRKAVLDV